MKFKPPITNRFAFLPTICDKCGEYVWLERYRRMYNHGLSIPYPNSITVAYCKDCAKQLLKRGKND